MKKITALMFACLMLAAVSNAAVTVTKDGKQETLKDNAVVNVNGSSETEVDYNGLKVVIPQGVKATISQNAKGHIIIQSERLSNVKISNLTVNSDGKSTITVNPESYTLTVNSGKEVRITNVNGKTSSMTAGQSAVMVSFGTKEEAKEEVKEEVKTVKEEAKPAKTAKADVAEAAASNVPAFVLPGSESTANQQVSQNVEETLSPSAPR